MSRSIDSWKRRAYAYRVAGPLNELSMPVTAKLSRKFYEKFGDELTNELVEWFNQWEL